MTTPEDSQQPEPISEKPSLLKELKQPSFLKLFFPVLIMILVIASVCINSTYLPKYFTDLCEIVPRITEIGKNLTIMRSEIRNLSSNSSNSPDRIISLLQEVDSLENTLKEDSIEGRKIIKRYSAVLDLGNFVYFPGKTVKGINFFITPPCEIDDNNYCGFYINRELYDCIHPKRPEYGGIWSYDSADYKKISIPLVLIKTLLFSAILYLISCFISLIWLVLLGKIVKDEPKRRKIHKVLVILIIILLVVGLAGGLFIIYKYMSPREGIHSYNPVNPSYEAAQCQNTAEVDSNRLDSMGKDNLNITVGSKYCDNPQCSEICKSVCDTRRVGYVLGTYGDTPYCICGCST